MRILLPSRPVLQPLEWVINSGWLSAQVEIQHVEDDLQALKLLNSEDDIALIDPLIWARNRKSVRPILRSSVSLNSKGTDLWMLSHMRPDEVQQIIAPNRMDKSGEFSMVIIMSREYFGIPLEPSLSDDPVQDEYKGIIIWGPENYPQDPAAYVHSISQAWWLMTGKSWIRALPVQQESVTDTSTAESIWREISRHLSEQADTVALRISKQIGGSEEAWANLTSALSLSYGETEREALSELLSQAARVRLIPKIEETTLPRY